MAMNPRLKYSSLISFKAYSIPQMPLRGFILFDNKIQILRGQALVADQLNFFDKILFLEVGWEWRVFQFWSDWLGFNFVPIRHLKAVDLAGRFINRVWIAPPRRKQK